MFERFIIYAYSQDIRLAFSRIDLF